MRRVVYLWRLLDRRDWLVIGGALLMVMLGASWVGYVTGVHELRAARHRDCMEQVQAMARRARLQVVALADPCIVAQRAGRK